VRKKEKDRDEERKADRRGRRTKTGERI